MPFMVTKREANLVGSKQAKTLIRSHREPGYMKGEVTTLAIDKSGIFPLTVRILGCVDKKALSLVTDHHAKEAGFEDRDDFIRHWRGQLYGSNGLEPGAPSRLKDSAPIVIYRIHKMDVPPVMR